MYIIGQRVKLQASFSCGGVATDPGTVIFKLEKPDGSITTLTYGVDVALIKASTGIYYTYWDTAAQGPHTYRFAGTTPCVAASEATFEVAYSPF